MSYGDDFYGGGAFGAGAEGGNAEVVGVLASIAMAAPAETTMDGNVSGLVTSIAVGALAGAASGTTTLPWIPAAAGPAAEVWQPTATGDATVAGPAASITATAPAGVVSAEANPSVAGPVASVTVTAPAGVVAVAEPGPSSTVTVTAPAGATSGDATTTGVVTDISVVAPAGTASGSGSVSVDGVVATIVVASPAGTVSTDSSVAGVVTSITTTSPAGIVEVAAVGVAANVTATSPAGAASGDASATVAPVTITVASPAGTAAGALDVTVTGVVVSITTAGPAGIVEVAEPGPAGTITVAAPAGIVTATGPTVPPPVITVSAPVGIVVIVSTVGPGLDPGSPTVGPGQPPDTVEGPMLTVTVTARAGTVTGVNVPPVPGRPLTVALTAPAGEVEALSVDRSSAGIQLTLLADHVAYQPGVVRLSVADERDPEQRYFPEQGVWLFLDGEQTSAFPVELDPDTYTNDKVLYPVDDLTVGAHTITAGHWSSTRDERTTVTFYVDTAQTTTGAATPQYPPAVTSGRWTFQEYDFADLGEVLTYEFPTNPSRLEETYAEAAITTEATTAYDGPIVVWEGERRPDRWIISGEVLERIDHDALAYWSDINQRLWVTDEYGRTILAKIVSFKATRKRAQEHPWRHAYTMTFDVLDGPSVATFSGQFAEV